MRSLPRTALTLLFAAGLAACGRGEDDAPVRTPPEPGTRPESAGVLPVTDSVIVIRFDTVGDTIVVTPADRLVRRGATVRWRSEPADTSWVVAFAGETPFQGGRRVFNGGSTGQADARGPVDPQAATGTYKYNVFWPDGQGGYIPKDPKLVIVNENGDTTQVGGGE